MYRKLAAVGNQELEGYSYRQATERTPIYSSGKGTLTIYCPYYFLGLVMLKGIKLPRQVSIKKYSSVLKKK